MLFTCQGDNLAHAFACLGPGGSREVILTVATLRSLRIGADPQLTQWLRQRAEAAALAAAAIDLVLGARQPGAYVAGLVHDVGWALGYAVLAAQRPESRPVLFTDARLTREVVRRCHVALGTRVVAAWGLPAPVIEALANHHSPRPPDDGLAGVLRAALAILDSLGIGAEQPADELGALVALGLSVDAAAAMPTAVFGTLRRHGVVQERRGDRGGRVGDRERRLLRYLGAS